MEINTGINKVRGRALFLKKLLSTSMGPGVLERATTLMDHFQDQVGVMECENTYAAARLAQACLTVASNHEVAVEEMIRAVVALYPQVISSSIRLTTAEPTAEYRAEQRRIQEELDTQSVVGLSDLLETVDMAGLSVEGKRARGLLPAHYDTTETEQEEAGDFVDHLDTEDALAHVTFAADGSVMLACPRCGAGVKADGTSSIYPMGFDRFGCFECDHTFVTILNIDDNLSDGAVEAEAARKKEADFALYVRVTGPLRERGRILTALEDTVDSDMEIIDLENEP